MLAVVWRTSARDFDVDTFVREQGLSPDAIWRRGEKKRGKVQDASGFNLSIDRGGTLEKTLRDVRAFLKNNKKAVMALRKQGVQSILDFGFTVGPKRHLARSLRFPPKDLALLAELDIELEVSAYLSSDD